MAKVKKMEIPFPHFPHIREMAKMENVEIPHFLDQGNGKGGGEAHFPISLSAGKWRKWEMRNAGVL